MVYSMSMTGQRPAYAGLLFSRPTAKVPGKTGQRGAGILSLAALQPARRIGGYRVGNNVGSNNSSNATIITTNSRREQHGRVRRGQRTHHCSRECPL